MVHWVLETSPQLLSCILSSWLRTLDGQVPGALVQSPAIRDMYKISNCLACLGSTSYQSQIASPPHKKRRNIQRPRTLKIPMMSMKEGRELRDGITWSSQGKAWPSPLICLMTAWYAGWTVTFQINILHRHLKSPLQVRIGIGSASRPLWPQWAYVSCLRIFESCGLAE